MPDTVSLPQTSTDLTPEKPGDLWVFGYGSLMWRPGFNHVERMPGLLFGAHRALCVYSIRHRGTREKPGLVLGLDHGGSCRGVAFRVPAEEAAQTHAYLTEREQSHYVYRETLRPVQLDDGRRVKALAYVTERRHDNYARGLPREELLRLVLQGQGESGACRDYVLNTLAMLAELGIEDHALSWLGPALSEAS
ncbi:MAG: gamma-glutamylcyclotransferase [Proteobacteria bacterium]|nr:gamma-glutamylcyclotransferase [Pseudomonadota bacterium]